MVGVVDNNVDEEDKEVFAGLRDTTGKVPWRNARNFACSVVSYKPHIATAKAFYRIG